MGTKKEILEGTGREQELELHSKKAKRNRLAIISAVIVAIMGVSIYFAVAGHAEQNNINDVSDIPIKATWINPQVLDDTASIPVSEVENNWNVHFKVGTQDGNMTFMAYVLDGEIYVRANVCPPCHSIGFSLQQSTLVCDTCGTVFNAKTGAGINGACVAYPKAAVAYKVENGNIVMKSIDLVAAYEDTIKLTQLSEATAPSCHSDADESTAPGYGGSADRPRAPSCCGGI